MGLKSQRSAAAVAALAQGLERRAKVAIVVWYKSAHSDKPLLGGLFPLRQHPGALCTIHLVFLELPYAIDVKSMEMESLDDYIVDSTTSSKASTVCDNLIDSLMLPKGTLESGQVPNPFLRSWNQSVMKRVVDSSAELVHCRQSEGNYPMKPPPAVVELAKPAIKDFFDTFPLSESVAELAKKNKVKGKKQGKTVHTYKNFL
jgi:hypothetical protein